MFSVGEVLGQGWEDFKNNAGVLIVALIIGGVISVGVSYGGQFATMGLVAATKSQAVAYLMMIVMFLVNVVVQAFVMTGFIAIYLKVMRGQTAEVGDLFSQTDKLVPAIIANLFVSLGAVVGMVLLIIPGIIFAMLTFLTLWFVVDQSMAPVDAIKASIEATKGSLLNIFLFGLAAVGLVIVGMIPCGLGLLAVAPLLGLATGRIYEKLALQGGAPTAATTEAAPA